MLPSAFIDFLTGYMRSSKFTTVTRLHRGLILRWILWADGNPANAIPGYTTCPPAGRNGFPAGWTIQNFRQIHRDLISPDLRAKLRTPII